MATVWLDSDLDGLIRLAKLKDEIDRDPSKAALHAQVTQLEDRFGLSPAARRKLQWEISKAQSDEEEGAAQPIRHLRAVK